MSGNLQKLQDINIQKIHEKTHISRKHVKALLDEDFKDLNKIQFLGFITILEREYELDLKELRESGLEHFQQIQNDTDISKKKLFLAPKRRKNYTKIYLLLVALMLVAVAFYTDSIQPDIKNDKIKNDLVIPKELNVTKDKIVDEVNVTKPEVVVQKPKKEIVKTIVKSLKIIPKRKLWMGYMDLKTGKKKQKLFSGELALDPDKKWLLFLGHGDVSFEIDGNKTVFHSKKNIKLLYKNSTLKKISFKEFKRLNKGDRW